MILNIVGLFADIFTCILLAAMSVGVIFLLAKFIRDVINDDLF